jgi:glycosyltransferase involved in cell wall biosynthesis
MQGSTDGGPLSSVRRMSASSPAGAIVRVAVDATPLLGHPTGVGAFCQGALDALAGRSALDVRAYAVSWRRRHGIEAKLPAGVTTRQRAMPARPLHALWGHTALPPVEWFVGDVDVVHGTNFVVPPTKKASVASVHDLTPLHHPELCDAATLAFPRLIARAVGRGAWIHTDSEFVAGEVLEAFEVAPERVRVVHPGVPPLPHLETDAAQRILDRWEGLRGRRFVLSVGTAEPRKDLPGLVEAFDQVAAQEDDVALVLAGPPGWGEQELDAAIHRSRWQARIVRTGWLEDDALSALFGQASVLAYPSRYEGFGFPPLQAMRAGVPVVATRAGSLPEVLGDAAAVVEVGRPDALADALVQALGDDTLRRRLIAAGTARAAGFSWERCGDGLEALYRDVVREHGA